MPVEIIDLEGRVVHGFGTVVDEGKITKRAAAALGNGDWGLGYRRKLNKVSGTSNRRRRLRCPHAVFVRVRQEAGALLGRTQVPFDAGNGLSVTSFGRIPFGECLLPRRCCHGSD